MFFKGNRGVEGMVSPAQRGPGMPKLLDRVLCKFRVHKKDHSYSHFGSVVVLYEYCARCGKQFPPKAVGP